MEERKTLFEESATLEALECLPNNVPNIVVIGDANVTVNYWSSEPCGAVSNPADDEEE